jgi:hypothetical protein
VSKNEETLSVLYLVILIMVIVYVQEGSMICGGVKRDECKKCGYFNGISTPRI